MEILIKEISQAFNSTAGRLFATEVGIDYPIDFCLDLVRVFTPSFRAAKMLFKEKRKQLADACRDWDQSVVEIFSPDRSHPIPISATPLVRSCLHQCQSGDFTMSDTIQKPSLFIGVMRLGAVLRPQIDYILSNPSKKLALTRISDNAQLILSEASAKAFKSDGEEAVKRKTSDFWLSEDIQLLQQMYRDCGSSGFELTYTASLDKPKTDPSACWGSFTTRYQLIEDDFGIVYRLGEIIDLVEIERPLILT
jgi:hypothetical protein